MEAKETGTILEKPEEQPTAHDDDSATLHGTILAKVRELPREQQKQVLDFVEFLQEKRHRSPSGPDLFGMYAHLGIHITEEDIAEARREMWGNFPREFPE